MFLEKLSDYILIQLMSNVLTCGTQWLSGDNQPETVNSCKPGVPFVGHRQTV